MIDVARGYVTTTGTGTSTIGRAGILADTTVDGRRMIHHRDRYLRIFSQITSAEGEDPIICGLYYYRDDVGALVDALQRNGVNLHISPDLIREVLEAQMLRHGIDLEIGDAR